MGLTAGAWLLGQVLLFEHAASPAVYASIAALAGPARLDTPVDVQLQGAGVQLADVHLFRTSAVDPASQAHEAAVEVTPRAQAQTDWRLIAPDGGSVLRPDGDYRLVVDTLEPRPSLPLPRTEIVAHEYRFSTVLAPRLQTPTGPVQPRWAQPFSATWTLPMASVSARTVPPAPVRTWVDPGDPHRTWFQLGGESGVGLTAGQTYEVHVDGGRSSDGLDLQTPATLQVRTPLRPRLVDVPASPVVLQYGDQLQLQASADLADARVETSDGVTTDLQLEGDRMSVRLPAFSQGMDFDLTVTAATSTEGAPLPEPVALHVQTPDALAPPEVKPADGQTVPPTTHPSITFAEAVVDRAAAEAAIQLDPPIPGTWTWTAPERVEFVPNGRLPVLTSLRVTVHGGPDGPRNEAGGYLEDDVTTSFRTGHDKRIDVSLDRQQVTLVQDGQAIRTIPAATGVAGAPTPVGNFRVQYKMPVARFTGANPDGSHYDIPDVHWVLAFMGDYTIHGAYWRARFGTPGSDGCVSMTDADAKTVFEWADDGTPITIHH